jgi:hypothetical protein
MGRLTEEFTLDQYSLVTSARMSYVRSKVKGVRMRCSRGEAFGRAAPTPATEGGAHLPAGRQLPELLPESVPGSTLYQRRLVDEGLAVIRTHGKPTYLITMTANPNWPELVEARAAFGIRANQQTPPSVVNRAFRLRAEALLQDLRNGSVFGHPAVYMLWVYEFQKVGSSQTACARAVVCATFTTPPPPHTHTHTHTLARVPACHCTISCLLSCISLPSLATPGVRVHDAARAQRGLPHIHIAVRVEGQQPTTPELADLHVQATLPGEDEPELRRLVSKFMIHRCVPGRCFPEQGPGVTGCGPGVGGCDRHTGRPIVPGTCKYGFPFPAQPTTTIDDGDRVRYKRGRQDSCVASYNSVLLARYQTHINVDIAATARVVAYIRKYMCKVRVVRGVRDANPRLL